MSDSGGGQIGGALQAALNITEYVLGNNTKTTVSSNGATQQTSTADTSVSSDTNTNNTSFSQTQSDQDTKSNSDTLTTNSVVNSADPGVIATLKSLASTAISNSTDPSKTTGLLSGILQQAGDAMSAIFGQQKQAGLYNSASVISQNNDILSRAAAEASQAILGYQTGQQTLADQALNQLLGATATQTTTGEVKQNSDVNTGSVSQTGTVMNSDVKDSATTSSTSANDTASQSQQTTSTHTGLSVVCTWMYKNKRLSARRYFVVSDDLFRKTWYVQKAYLAMAAPLVKVLEKDHTTRFSRAIIAIFSARTEYVCAKRGMRECEQKWSGGLARLAIATYVAPLGIALWAGDLLGAPVSKELVVK